MNYDFLKVEEPRKISDIDGLMKPYFEIPNSVKRRVAKILKSVKEYGDRAVIKLCKRFDGFKIKNIDDIRVREAEKEKACQEAIKKYPRLIEALDISYHNIELYHTNQFKKESLSWTIQPAKGKKVGQIFSPIERVGIYIPGGRYIYPSSVLMTVVPAKVAGVKEIAVCTPPQKNGNINEILLYLFAKLDIKEIYKIGGAQAIAFLAYGTETIRKVDKIIGPGNIYVTAAKKRVFGLVGIDSLAGPSEVVILSDKKANPTFIASDLLSQAEHDPDAKSILLSTDKDVSKRVIQKIYEQLDALSKIENNRRNVKVILKSLNKNCRVIYHESRDFLIEICNRLAPEHLEIMMDDTDSVLKEIKNAGAIFLGDYSPVAVGDYIGGTNHVIPTSGTARFSSPLGVYDFCKKSSLTSYDYNMLMKERDYIEILSDFEGLVAHKNSVKIRYENSLHGK